MLSPLVHLILTRIRTHWQQFRKDDRGYTTETVVVTALLVVLALAVIAIIVAKVIEKANSITM